MKDRPQRRRLGNPMNPKGKPCGQPEVVEKINLKEVEKLSAVGMSIRSIAKFFGVGERTMERYIAERPEVTEAVQRGAAKGQKLALGYLANAMEKGNVMAIIFYLVNKHPDEWQSVNKGFQITNNVENTNGQFGQMIAKDKEAGRMATDLVKRLSNKIPDATDGK